MRTLNNEPAGGTQSRWLVLLQRIKIGQKILHHCDNVLVASIGKVANFSVVAQAGTREQVQLEHIHALPCISVVHYCKKEKVYLTELIIWRYHSNFAKNVVRSNRVLCAFWVCNALEMIL